MKILLGGTEVSATELQFRPGAGGEPWTDYILEDGTIVRFRAVILSIARIDNTYSQNGDPVYQTQNQNIMHVISPDHLKQKSAEKVSVQ